MKRTTLASRMEKLGIVDRSSKTPAQRDAPLKAAATRKAKKAAKLPKEGQKVA